MFASLRIKAKRIRREQAALANFPWFRAGYYAALDDIERTGLRPTTDTTKREAEIVYEFAGTVRRRGRLRRDGANHLTQEETATRMRLIEELEVIRGRSVAPVVVRA